LNILPPLQVIQILSNSPHATIGLITSYISTTVLKEKQEINEDLERIGKDQRETQKNRQEIQDLTSGVIKFQRHKCSRCNDPLDLPTYHFYCHHSFHQRCLGENENICSECSEANKDFKNRQKALEEGKKKHSDFFRQLEQAYDGFGVCAKYFGRGMFDKFAEQPLGLPTLDPNLFDLGDLTLGLSNK